MAATAEAPLAAGSAEPAPGASRTSPVLLTTWSCPYAQRTWIAALAKGLDFQPVHVDLANKPDWFFKVNPYGRVPTLVWKEADGTTASLYESLVCNEFIADLQGTALLPSDPVARARARLAIDQFGARVGSAFGKVMFADAAGAAGPAAELDAALQWLEGELAASAGPFFLGPDFSLVDAALGPFVLRLSLLEGLGNYKVPTGLPRLKAFQEALLAHPAVRGSMQPPAGQDYFAALLDNYKQFVAKRRAAAAQ